MMEVESPEYSGPRITAELESNLELMVGLTPLELSQSSCEGDRRYLGGYYVSTQLQLHSVLSSVVGGETQVCESLLLPSSGLVYYVVRLREGIL